LAPRASRGLAVATPQYQASAPEQPSPVQLLQSARELCLGEALERAWDLAEPFGGSRPAKDSLALLVGAAASAGDLPRARRLCLRLLALDGGGKQGVPVAVWQALISAHARAGDADAAFGMLGSLESVTGASQAQVPPAVFEALICGLVESRNLPAAFDAFRRLRTWALAEPGPALCAAMVRAYGHMGDVEQAVRLYDELAARQAPTPELRAELIVALAGRWRTAREAFRLAGEAQRQGDPLLPRTAGALAAACARGGLADEARALLRRLKAAGLELDTRARADLIRAFGVAAARCQGDADSERARLLAHAWRLVQEGARPGSGLPTEVLNALLEAYCASGLTAYAEELLGMGLELRCAPDAESFSLVLEALRGEPHRFRALWGRLLAASAVRPTPGMLQCALEVAVEAQDARWAASLLHLLFAAKAAPSAKSASALRALPGGATAGSIRQLLRAFERQGLFPRGDPPERAGRES